MTHPNFVFVFLVIRDCPDSGLFDVDRTHWSCPYEATEKEPKQNRRNVNVNVN